MQCVLQGAEASQQEAFASPGSNPGPFSVESRNAGACACHSRNRYRVLYIAPLIVVFEGGLGGGGGLGRQRQPKWAD